MEWCFTCGNDGLEDQPCPDCGKQKNIIVLEELPQQDLNKFFVKTTRSQIPEFYEGNFWERDKLIASHVREFADVLLARFADSLQIVHDMFMQKGLPAKSILVIAPSTYSKTTWAYSCMQYALNAGYSVPPMLDTMEVKRLMVVSVTNPNYKINGLNYDSYMESPVVFITVTKLEYHQEAYGVIEELVSRRSRMGYPTFIISRYETEELSGWDRTKNFSRMARAKADDNFMKFLSVIRYKEEHYVK